MRVLIMPAALLVAVSAHAVTLVNDTFSDTDRIGGLSGSTTTSSSPVIGTPTSTNTQWIGTRVSQLVASPTGMLWTTDASSRVVTGYFPNVTLAANTVTTFSLSFTTGAFGGTASNLRIALTDGTAGSAGIRTTDGVGNTDATYVGDVGYGFFSGASTVGGGNTTNLTMNARQREVTTSNTLLGTAADWDPSLGGSSGATGYFDANTAYTMSFAFDYTGSSLAITTAITGGNFAGMSYTVTDTTSLVTLFNQFSLRLGGGSTQFASINFTNFSVNQIAAIPEPSTCAFIASALGLGLAAWRRQRRVRA